LCGGCQTHPADWDVELGGHPQAYVTAFWQCPGCLQIESAKRQLAEAPLPSREGVHVALVPNPDLRD
jgi:hypothetical protein